MDRIERAMEKAKLSADKGLANKNRPRGGRNNSHSKLMTRDNEKIEYTQTRKNEIARNQDELVQRRVVAHQKYSPDASIFKMLRTKVLKKLRENDWNSFAVTAPTQGVGKSFVSVNLAIAMAMEVNQTVLLVDMDLKYPRINWYLDMDVKVGLRDHLVSEVPISEILVNPGIERLVVLPGRGEAVGSSEMVSSPKMRELVEDLKSYYQSRIIIFDMPPVLAADDVLASMDYYDALLMVVEEGGNTPAEIKKAMQMVSGTNILGTVLNKSENPPEHQTYY